MINPCCAAPAAHCDNRMFVLQAAHCADAIHDLINVLLCGPSEMTVEVFGEVASSYQHPLEDRQTAVLAQAAAVRSGNSLVVCDLSRPSRCTNISQEFRDATILFRGRPGGL